MMCGEPQDCARNSLLKLYNFLPESTTTVVCYGTFLRMQCDMIAMVIMSFGICNKSMVPTILPTEQIYARSKMPPYSEAGSQSQPPGNTTQATAKRRAAVACKGCNQRKVRCNVTTVGPPCTNCELDNTLCEIAQRKKHR